MLHELPDELPNEKIHVEFICDGSLTPQKEFNEYVSKQNPNKQMAYLYDFNNVLTKELEYIPGYQFEIDFKEKKPVKFYLGFNNETISIMKSERVKTFSQP